MPVKICPICLHEFLVNPIKAGWSESMNSLGGAPPLEKALENSYRVEMHVHSLIFQDQLKEKKSFDKIEFIV